MGNLIDRRMACVIIEKEFRELAKEDEDRELCQCFEDIVKMVIRLKVPDATQEVSGKWGILKSELLDGGGICACSTCLRGFALDANFEPERWNYCPNCGSYNGGVQL